MWSLIRSAARRFRRDQSGLSAIEFAFIAPIMVTALLGSAELSNSMVAERKLSDAASTIADLTAQATAVSGNDLSNIMDCGATIMTPLPTGTLAIRISSVVMGANNTAKVAWSTGRGMSARAVNSVVAVPTGLIATGESVIYSEVQYTFTSAFGSFLPVSGAAMTDSFMLRPRRSLTVTKTS